MQTEKFRIQETRWPQSGRHILAQYNDENVVVYQAYRPSIAMFAVEHQVFGGEFSYSRMSWIKPNFLWMMYRSGWGTKAGQERVLAVTIPRSLFDEILAVAVPSTYVEAQYPEHLAWKRALSSSDVRLQWDPDHAPDGSALERRAIQLGLRGEMLLRFGKEEVVSIQDISEFVGRQQGALRGSLDDLETPLEEVYRPALDDACRNVGLESVPDSRTVAGMQAPNEA